MKLLYNNLRMISLVLVLLSISIFILSCNGDDMDNRGKNTMVDQTVDIDIVKNGETEYTIVYYSDYRDVAVAVQEKILSLTGARLDMTYDPDVRSDKEIVIGSSHSSDYYNDPIWELLYKNDYQIAAYNERIVIQGGNVTAYERALDSFSQMLDESVSDNNLTITLNQGMNIPDSEPLTLVSNGESQYKIVRSSNSGPMTTIAAQSFYNEIKDSTNVHLLHTTDSSDESDYEILIGETNRKIDVDISALGYMDYIIKLQGTRLIIVGGSDPATELAARHFFALFGKSEKISTGNFTIDFYDFEYKSNYSPSIITVMTANVLNNDNHGGQNNTILKRIPRMVNLTTSYMPDLIGVQEFNSVWIRTFVPLLTKYGYKHAYEQDSKVSVIYNAERIKIHEVKSWYYSDTPAIRSLTWGEANQRLLTYAICELIQTGEKFVFISTHYVVGSSETLVESRNKATRILLDKAEELGLPTIVVGDFNCTSTSEAYKMLNSAIGDARHTSRVSRGPQFTYNGMDGRRSGNIIDYIFASKEEFELWMHIIVNEKIDGQYYSDHNALVAELELKK